MVEEIRQRVRVVNGALVLSGRYNLRQHITTIHLTRNFLTSPDDASEFRTENLWKIKLFFRRSLDLQSFLHLMLNTLTWRVRDGAVVERPSYKVKDLNCGGCPAGLCVIK